MLSGPERATFLTAVLLLPGVAVGTRLFGLKRCQTFLLNHSGASNKFAPQTQENQAKSTARLVRAAAMHGLRKGNCLQQSLCLWWLLNRQGIKTQLRIGMQQEQNQIKGHAWVEYEGAVLNDEPDVPNRYTPILNYQGALFYD